MDLDVFLFMFSFKFLCVLVFVIVLFITTGLYVTRWHFTRGKRRCVSDEDMSGKTVIITGANTGIGKETARALAKRGARVILACRCVKRGNDAMQEIIQTTGNTNIIVRECNLASLKSVRNFAFDVLNSEERVDVLICNAGTGTPFGRHLTEDGLELQFQTNHLGHFLLVNLLLELLRNSAPARIVITSSLAHQFGRISLDNMDNLVKAHKYVNHPFLLYCDTKLANVLFMKELSRLLQDTGVTANALNPGTVYTNSIRYNKIWYIKWFLLFLCFLYNKTEEDGAQTIIHLAVSREVQDISGKFFSECEESNYSPLADDEVLASALWRMSAKLVDCTKVI